MFFQNFQPILDDTFGWKISAVKFLPKQQLRFDKGIVLHEAFDREILFIIGPTHVKIGIKSVLRTSDDF